MNKEQEILDADIEKRLIGMMKENSPKLLSYFLAVTGKLMVEANAGTMTVHHEATHNGQRYKTKAVFTIKKIKS